MNNNERMRQIFNKAYVRAIMKREEVKQPYIILDNLLYNSGMEFYAESAKNRIFEMEGSDFLFEHDHIQISLDNGNMLIDEAAMIACQEIVLGYVSNKVYKSTYELLEAQGSLVRYENRSLKFYQEKKIRELMKGLIEYIAKKSETEEDRSLNHGVIKCHLLELVSRSWPVRIYWKLYDLSVYVTAHIIARRFVATSK